MAGGQALSARLEPLQVTMGRALGVHGAQAAAELAHAVGELGHAALQLGCAARQGLGRRGGLLRPALQRLRALLQLQHAAAQPVYALLRAGG